MKHTTKAGLRPTKKTKLRMIGLRLDDELMAEVERLAHDEERSRADMARICVRIGLREIKARGDRATGQ